MFNNHSGALSQYGVSAMDKLFTLYDAQATAPAGVTTVNGTLGWKYVSGGLSASSGVAGQLSDGQYFVQLDQSGGGVESLLPGDANGDGKVDVNDLTDRAEPLRSERQELEHGRLHRRRQGQRQRPDDRIDQLRQEHRFVRGGAGRRAGAVGPADG